LPSEMHATVCMPYETRRVDSWQGACCVMSEQPQPLRFTPVYRRSEQAETDAGHTSSGPGLKVPCTKSRAQIQRTFAQG
jgi:hypothetical protein